MARDRRTGRVMRWDVWRASDGCTLAPIRPRHKRKRPVSRTGRRRRKRRLRELRGPAKTNYSGRVHETEGVPQYISWRTVPVIHSISPFSRCRAITMRWISLVPSPISQIFASRMKRSTG